METEVEVPSTDAEEKTIPTGPLLPVVRTTLEIYPIDNYTFGTKATAPLAKSPLKFDPFTCERDYQIHGMLQSVAAVLIVHDHGHPHLLLLQLADRENCYQL